jgi:hypothetical protein
MATAATSYRNRFPTASATETAAENTVRDIKERVRNPRVRSRDRVQSRPATTATPPRSAAAR